MQFELFKKTSSYVDKDGKKRQSVQFYVKVNESLIPVEPTYYHKKDEKGVEIQDYGYGKRKAVLEAVATELPEKVEKK